MVEVATDEFFGSERKKKEGGYRFIHWELRDGQARLT